LGPDEKIYLSTGRSNLHVINDPNQSGQNCNLVMGQQLLNGRSSQMALPNINPNFYTNKPVDFSFSGGGNCSGLIQFTSQIKLSGVTLSWDFGDGEFGTGPNPIHNYKIPNKEYFVKLIATDNIGCVYDVSGKILVPSAGKMKAGFSAAMECNQLKIALLDTSKYSEGAYKTIFYFGDGTTSTFNNPIHVYPKFGTYTVMQISSAPGDCIKDTVQKTFTFTKPSIKAGPDVEATSADPIQLNASGGIKYHWQPSTNLTNPDIANPLMYPRDEMTYVVTGYNAEGCSNIDTISIKIKKTLRIDVPSGFVPGGNKNNLLRPILRLIDHINYFRVYNRWGQLVFETKEIGKGWDGTIKGDKQPTGTYTWMLEVVDLEGVIHKKTGASVLIR
jgi:gliding motility-associated-like protein